ncbi:MAG: response regulator transcription factor [Clostridia bacterium]|nr:response regulator transcription factor [Clostridia bacterium]
MIFHVEDERNIRDLVVFTLRMTGFEAEGLEDGAALRRALQHTTPELILLDVMMPGEDGNAILRWLRSDSRYRRIPVIMLTAKGTELDTVAGLDGGADDYIAKPFSMMELIARIKALLRRSKGDADRPSLVVGRILLDSSAHRVLSDGREVALTNKEFELLRCLMKNAGRAFDREQLLQAVWGADYFGGSRTVDVHIQTLRQKLGAPGNQIETIYGLGYKMGDEG